MYYRCTLSVPFCSGSRYFIKYVLQVDTFRPTLFRLKMFTKYILQVDTFRPILFRLMMFIQCAGGHIPPLEDGGLVRRQGGRMGSPALHPPTPTPTGEVGVGVKMQMRHLIVTCHVAFLEVLIEAGTPV